MMLKEGHLEITIAAIILQIFMYLKAGGSYSSYSSYNLFITVQTIKKRKHTIDLSHFI